jgi:hypothetical protein
VLRRGEQQVLFTQRLFPVPRQPLERCQTPVPKGKRVGRPRIRPLDSSMGTAEVSRPLEPVRRVTKGAKQEDSGTFCAGQLGRFRPERLTLLGRGKGLLALEE